VSQFFREKREHSFNIASKEDILISMGITHEMALAAGFTETESIFLKLATEEACTNAVEHCERFGSIDFDVIWLTELDRMEISVSQKGGWFEFPDALQADLAPRGRGLALIQGIMDEVRLIQTSTNVVFWMRKDRRNNNDDPSSEA
jgi:serine/threonine-protein kinase RsbW